MLTELYSYFRDSKKMNEEEWENLLINDYRESLPENHGGISDIWYDKKQERHINDIKNIDDVHYYLYSCTYIVINKHVYAIKTKGYSYDSFEHLRSDVLGEAEEDYTLHPLISEIIENLNGEELKDFFSKSEKIYLSDGKIIREVDEDD